MISKINQLQSSRFKGFIRSLISYHYLKYRKGKVLDIGSGIGMFGVYKDYTALEPNEEAVRVMKSKGINAIRGVGQKIPFKDKSFDTVTCFHVLEHTKNGERIIEEAYRVLKRKGIFILVVPDWDTYNDYIDYGHIWFYSLDDCESCMKKTGFDIIKTGTDHQFFTGKFKFVREVYLIGDKK
jgi:ubiquinone/menaquinone biosynthesis C-methylase UbiE